MAATRGAIESAWEGYELCGHEKTKKTMWRTWNALGGHGVKMGWLFLVVALVVVQVVLVFV